MVGAFPPPQYLHAFVQAVVVVVSVVAAGVVLVAFCLRLLFLFL